MPFQNEKRCSSELNKYASVERLKVGEITDVLLSQGWLLLLRFFFKAVWVFEPGETVLRFCCAHE